MIGRLLDSDPDKTLVDPVAAAPPALSGSGMLVHPLPARIARFEILRKLGEGGMGVVYEANDPELGRRVAIKVMRASQRAEHDSHGKDRMMREAKTMARLSHPNVVQVYEVDEFGDAMFLAMELVAGVDLRQWLKVRRRKWREILGIFMQAGQGLAAAHAVGVVHRDFKPDNVLVGDDGRVRVLDFGLARPLRVGDPEELISGVSRSGNRITLTHANSYVGTPAYMSPEQHTRGRAEARSDQFSFCVALYEGLYGERPFAGKTIAEVRASVFRAIPPPPKGRRVPARLRKILLRGLSVSLEDRFPDMPALLRALAVDPARPWKRAGMVAATLAVAGVGALGYAGWLDQNRMQCIHGASVVAAVWNPERAAAGAAAFARTGVAYASETWPKVQAELDAHAAAWAAQRDAACRATHERGEASVALLDLRNQCLDERLRELGAVADAFATADAATVERALQAATGLVPLSTCESEAAVSTRVRLPADPALAHEVSRARDLLARAAGRREAGRPLESREMAASVERTTASLGYPPLQAEVLLELGRSEEGTADYGLAVDHLTRAYHDGLAIGHDTVAAEAAITLSLVLHRQGKQDLSLAWSDHARSMVLRTGERPDLNVLYLLYRSYTLGDLGRHAEAIAAAERALEIARAEFRATDPRIGRLIGGVAHAHWNNGDDERALALFQMSKDVWQAGVGADHPFLASSATNIAAIYYDRHEYDLALAEARPALEMMTRAYGPDHPRVANVLGNLGAIALAQGRFGEAVDDFTRSHEVLARKLGPDAPPVLDAAADLGSALLQIGRYDQALALHRRTLEIRRHRAADKAEPHPQARFELATTLADMRIAGEAEATFRDALTDAERAADPLFTVRALTGLARAARLRGALADADALSLRALDPAHDISPIDRAPAQVERGELLLALGRADEAVGACKEALLTLEKAYGASSHHDVPALQCLGRVYLARNQSGAAQEVLERSVKILEATDIRPADRADARAALALALRPRDPVRADALVTQALTDYAAAGPIFAADAARLAAAAAAKP